MSESLHAWRRAGAVAMGATVNIRFYPMQLQIEFGRHRNSPKGLDIVEVVKIHSVGY